MTEADDAGILLVDHLLSARGKVPDDSLRRTAELALDTVGAALAGGEADGVPAVTRVLTGWGGRPDAHVLGSRVRLPAHNAALLNSARARALELDDVHEKALVHATATTVPVALAVAQQCGQVDGRTFLDAVTLGNDVACRLALALDMDLGAPTHNPRVMSLTYQTGVLAGSLVAGLVAGVDRETLINCLGVGYSQVAGNLQGLFEGSLTVRLQQGIAAQSAVQALEFARAGIDGAHEALEGRAGWYPAFFGGRYGYSRDRLLDGLGQRFLGDEISIKLYACCKYGHNAISAAIELRDALGPALDDVSEVVIDVGQDTWDIICNPLEVKGSPAELGSQQALALAQFSMPFMIATALLRGRLTAAELDQEWRASPELARFLPKMTVRVGMNTQGVEMIPEPGRVTVLLGDGTRHTREVLRTPGHPDRPLPTEALHAKFRSSARSVPTEQVDRIIDTFEHLGDVEDVRLIAELCAS